MSAAARQKIGIRPQIARPAVLAVHALANTFPARPMALEMAVLELDARSPRRLGHEAYFDFTRLLQVRLDLPLRADVPAEHDALRRLVGQHPRPATLAAVDTAVEDAATHPRLEHGLGDL